MPPSPSEGHEAHIHGQLVIPSSGIENRLRGGTALAQAAGDMLRAADYNRTQGQFSWTVHKADHPSVNSVLK
jgi:hypothetical protein